MRTVQFRTLVTAMGCLAVSGVATAQATWIAKPLPRCSKQTAIEFISPMPTEEVPVGAINSAWHMLLEMSTEQIPGLEITPVTEGFYFPSPGVVVFPPTDVDGNGIVGDPHPAIPGLTLTLDDDLVVGGVLLPGGTNLASFIEAIGSEIEHGRDQSTTLSWIVDPGFMIIDTAVPVGSSTLKATINGVSDSVLVRHGFEPVAAFIAPQTPTVSIWTEDWLSTIDSEVPSSGETHAIVGVEVRIPCFFDMGTVPPTPVPFYPLPGPCAGLACTGTLPPACPGPGIHGAFPTLEVRFSDDYFDIDCGTFVPGGVLNGGPCGGPPFATGGNLAFTFEQASVQAWYGVDGVPHTMAVPGADDQMIYRFTMVVNGRIFDTDALPREMLITATVSTQSGCFSTTNARVSHRPDVRTP